MTLTIRIDGIPKGQPRARACVRGRHAGVYDPGTADGWKQTVIAALLPHRRPVPIDAPLYVSMNFYFPRPKSLCRRKDPPGPVLHTAKPDCDNASKAVLDAMVSMGFIRDDAKVCGLGVWKHYHAIGGRSGMELRVETVGESGAKGTVTA